MTKRLAAFLLCGLAACAPEPPPDPGWGVELVYRVLDRFEHENEAEKAKQEAVRVLEKRLKGLGYPHAKAAPEGADKVRVRIPGIDTDGLPKAKRVIASSGDLKLHESAPREVQEKFNRDKQVTTGFKAFMNVEKDKRQEGGEYRAWSGDVLLLKAEPTVDNSMIAQAKPEQSMGAMGLQWVVVFELTKEGSVRFDESAARLFNRDPAGVLAIVLDGAIRSIPRVMTDKFGGSGQITGFENEPEARTMVLILNSGALPVKLGCMRDGKAVPGEPESESFYGTKEPAKER